jgi:transitional endoplasmic reticulum ATPase
MHTTNLDVRLASSHDVPAAEYYHHHSSAPRVNTDVVILNAIEEQYPQKHVTITPEQNCDLIGYAVAGHAVANSVNDTNQRLCSKWRSYIPPAKRLDGDTGELVDMILFGKYHYAWRNYEFILYLVDGRDGAGAYPVRNNYIVGDESAAGQLILEVGNFNAILHNQIWVSNQSFWSKDAELWKSISHASWKDVILDEEMKTNYRQRRSPIL